MSEFPPNMPSNIRSAFEGLERPTGPAVPEIAMFDLVQILMDYRFAAGEPTATRIVMSVLARRAFLAEMARTRRSVPTRSEAPPWPDTLPIVLDARAEGFLIRVE